MSSSYLRALPDIVQLPHIPRRTYVLRLTDAAIVTPSIASSDTSKSSVFVEHCVCQRLRVSHTLEQYILAIRRTRVFMFARWIRERKCAVGGYDADLHISCVN